MNLDGVRTGRTVLITGTGLTAARERRLAELGIRTGQPVQVLGRTAGGGRLLAVGDARVAVDRTTARGIGVAEPAAPPAPAPRSHQLARHGVPHPVLRARAA